MNVQRFRRLLRRMHYIDVNPHLRHTPTAPVTRTTGRPRAAVQWACDLLSTPRPILGLALSAVLLVGLIFTLFATRDESTIVRPVETQPTMSSTPSSSTAVPPPSGPIAQPSAPAGLAPRPHQVVAGESLADVALRFGVGVEDIAAANHIPNANRIQVGRELLIPAAVPGAVVIQPGTTLTDYARWHGHSVGELLALNPQIADRDRILAGARLVITGQVAR